ncbi:MAG: MipA/OmpV family protein, partial [Alphaproteobacteria bacterium]|nr:MipA/OmpV family protein [Alphaproteobacteria bacterium]
HQIVSGDTGGYFRLGATQTYRVSHPLELKARVGVTYADGDYMEDYFGITTAQSINSKAGLAAFDTDAGFKDVHVVLSATYDIDPNWTLIGGVGYKRLIGDAEDSPIVESEDQFLATFGIMYRFSLNR